MNGYTAFLKKELTENIKNYRFLILFAVLRTSQSLCKPPVWCRIEAPHRRNYI